MVLLLKARRLTRLLQFQCGQQVESKCRIFSQYEETVDHTISGCEVLAKKEYIFRHNNAAAYLHWSICKDHDIEISEKWHLQESETVMHNKGKKVLNKVLEQFEQYYNPRKNVVFERHQFWQITQKDSENVGQFVTHLKNKVKSCDYSSPVDDMVRDKFVISIRDLQVKERLLREEKLTLEKAISMARVSEASKEQIKVMGPKE